MWWAWTVMLSRARYHRVGLGSDGVRVCVAGSTSSCVHVVLMLATAAASPGLRWTGRISSCVCVVLVLVTAAVPVVLR